MNARLDSKSPSSSKHRQKKTLRGLRPFVVFVISRVCAFRVFRGEELVAHSEQVRTKTLRGLRPFVVFVMGRL